MKNIRVLILPLLFALGTPSFGQTQPTEPSRPDGLTDPDYEVPAELNLDYALAFALDNNHAIRQARERIRQQEGILIEVRASQIPNVTAGADYSRNDRDISQSFVSADRNWGINLQATQLIYAGGGVTAAVKSASLAREAAMLELQGVINDQLLLVRTRFYAMLLARERIGVQEENVKLLEQQLKDVRSRFDAGAVSNFEVLRAEVALANGRPALISARNAWRVGIEELRQVLGFVNASGANVAKVPAFIGSLEPGPEISFDLRDGLQVARAQRPELQRLGKLEDAGVELVTVNRAGYQPQLALYGRYDWVRGGPSSGWGDRRDGWTAGVQAQWSIFDGRATAGRVAQARSQLTQTRLAIEEATLAIDVEVRRAHSAFTEAWELLDASGKVVEQAQEALRLADVRYGAGSATQLDVLTSQVALTEARLNQLISYFNYNVALAAMRKAIGQADPFVRS
jgi:outer membrane protein TolC